MNDQEDVESEVAIRQERDLRRLLAAGGALDVDEDVRRWARQSPTRREEASRRLLVVLVWLRAAEAGRRLSAKIVARRAGITPNQLYRISKRFLEAPSISALGTFAANPAQRAKRIPAADVAVVDGAIRRLVPAMVGAPIEQIVLRVQEEARGLGRLPGSTTLRAMVAKAVGEASEATPPGRRLALDVCAVEVLRPDGSPHLAFCLLDVGSRKIIATRYGALGNSVQAYRSTINRTLHEAEKTFLGGFGPCVPLEEIVVTAGADVDDWTSMVTALGEPFVLASGGQRRWGRSLTAACGDRIGWMRLKPGWTRRSDQPAPKGSRAPEMQIDVFDRELFYAAMRHNAALDLPVEDDEKAPFPIAALRAAGARLLLATGKVIAARKEAASE